MFNFRLKYQYLGNNKNELSTHRNVSWHFVHRRFSRGDPNCFYGFNIYQNYSTVQRQLYTFSSIVYLCQNLCERDIKWKWNDSKRHHSSASTLHQWTLFDIQSIATQYICFWFFKTSSKDKWVDATAATRVCISLKPNSKKTI